MDIIARYQTELLSFTHRISQFGGVGRFKHTEAGSGDSAHFQTETSVCERDLERAALLTLTSAHLPNAENKLQMQLC